MGHVCTHDDGPGPHEHPVVAVIAIIAMVAAILLIMGVRIAVHGTDDLEAALAEPVAKNGKLIPVKPDARPDDEREVEAAVTSSRFATGFSP
jgi:hypothetical protein